MNSKELIKRVIEFDAPSRIGLNFNENHPSDIVFSGVDWFESNEYDQYSQWGHYEDILKQVPGFGGEIRLDKMGNIYGRLEGKTKGECIKGFLQDGWERLEDFKAPRLNAGKYPEAAAWNEKYKDKFTGIGIFSIFSSIRDLRKMENIMMDILLEEEMVKKVSSIIEETNVRLIEKSAELGFDSIFMCDDWGTQISLLINPVHWRKIFKPFYERIAKAAHEHEMKFLLHSCGYIYDIVGDLIEAGVDVLQLDQPALLGVEKLGAEFGGKVSFWSPVDIQTVLQSGDKKLIQLEALKMIEHFGKHHGGFIAKDYPSLDDINVKDEWAQWARDVFIKKGNYAVDSDK